MNAGFSKIQEIRAGFLFRKQASQSCLYGRLRNIKHRLRRLNVLDCV